MTINPPGQTAGGMFTPKIVSILKIEGYSLPELRADAVAGLTVAIVALPLSMALAIASGVSPDKGLITAIIGGLVISLMSGSRFQIGGPAGAFIVLLASMVEHRGVDGLILSTCLAGVILVIAGFMRFGSLIRLVPAAVVTGFTAAIAILIFASQIHDFLGLTLTAKEPSELLPRLLALGAAWPTFNSAALLVALFSLALILALRRIRPTWPGFLIAVVISTVIVLVLKLPVETIGSRFGGIADRLPWPSLPSVTRASIIEALPDAAAIALLGGIESLLCAVVADGMSNRRHRSNAELVAQGLGNIASSLFGGICVTGTIARTATNVRAGARTPIAGVIHSLFLLAFVMLAAPLAALIPLSCLAAMLTVVCLNMFGYDEIVELARRSWRNALVLGVTFAVTIVTTDLIIGISAGCALALLLHVLPRSDLVKG